MVVRISVITPVYNNRRVVRAVRSVLAQEGDFEVESIVIDGASPDPGMVTALQSLRAYGCDVVSEPDEGVFDAMNKGVARASGDIVGILNADDWYVDDLVLSDVANALSDPSVDLCFGDLTYVDAQSRPVRVWRSGPAATWKWYLGWMPPHPTVFLRRRVYDKVGSFNLRYPIAADYDLVFRAMVCHGASSKHVPRQWVRMTAGGQSSAGLGAIIQSNIEVWNIWKEHTRLPPFWVPILKPLSKLLQVAAALRHRFSRAHRPGRGPDESDS